MEFDQNLLQPTHLNKMDGLSELLNHALVEAARSMLSHAGLGNVYWTEAVVTVT